MVIDESHQTIPQLGAMYKGDRSRKSTLVEYGFRLPSAMDNRPLNFQEFEERVGQTIYVSATPGNYELEKSGGEVVEQIIRPTGLLDPIVEVRPVRGQIDDLLNEVRKRTDSSSELDDINAWIKPPPAKSKARYDSSSSRDSPAKKLQKSVAPPGTGRKRPNQEGDRGHSKKARQT